MLLWLQSKLMVRLEEPGGDVVRLLVRTMRMTQQQPIRLPAAAEAAGAGARGDSAAGPAAAAAAVPGCEVLSEEESCWLVVSETFTPDVPR
jgi:hypothetical protein